MFSGKYQNSMDTKNRIIIPSKFRDKLGHFCVLTRGMDRCLYILSMQEWEKFTQKLSELPTTDINNRQFMRHFSANTTGEIRIDNQGRIVIPQDLKEYANMEQDIITIGVLDKIEVWGKEEWDKAENGTDLDPSDLAQKMKEYGI